MDFFGWFLREFREFRVVLRIQVAVVLGDVDVDFSARFQVRGGQFFGFVVAFRTPCYVVGVTEGVDV